MQAIFFDIEFYEKQFQNGHSLYVYMQYSLYWNEYMNDVSIYFKRFTLVDERFSRLLNTIKKEEMRNLPFDSWQKHHYTYSKVSMSK